MPQRDAPREPPPDCNTLDTGLMARIALLEKQVESLQMQTDTLRAGFLRHVYLPTHNAHG